MLVEGAGSRREPRRELDGADRRAAVAPLREQPEPCVEEPFLRSELDLHGIARYCMVNVRLPIGSGGVRAVQATAVAAGQGWTADRIFMAVSALWHLPV